jgi:hypothetical protein
MALEGAFNVRFGSKGDMCSALGDVRSSPMNVRKSGRPAHNVVARRSIKESKDQANVLEKEGFTLPKNGIVEAILVAREQILLLG